LTSSSPAKKPFNPWDSSSDEEDKKPKQSLSATTPKPTSTQPSKTTKVDDDDDWDDEDDKPAKPQSSIVKSVSAPAQTKTPQKKEWEEEDWDDDEGILYLLLIFKYLSLDVVPKQTKQQQPAKPSAKTPLGNTSRSSSTSSFGKPAASKKDNYDWDDDEDDVPKPSKQPLSRTGSTSSLGRSAPKQPAQPAKKTTVEEDNWDDDEDDIPPPKKPASTTPTTPQKAPVQPTTPAKKPSVDVDDWDDDEDKVKTQDDDEDEYPVPSMRLYWRLCRNTVAGDDRRLPQYCDRASNIIYTSTLIVKILSKGAGKATET
jgi:hypothetical protein